MKKMRLTIIMITFVRQAWKDHPQHSTLCNRSSYPSLDVVNNVWKVA